ncbi:hypothetical protein ACWCPQ_19285 [Nocardia sp. NPDC001965]
MTGDVGFEPRVVSRVNAASTRWRAWSLSAKRPTHGEMIGPAPTGIGQKRWTVRRKAALNAFDITCEGGRTAAHK